ncbi:uncharacterized protein E0L32_001089 [Thyridium curvatum]|uniref:S-adenosyl-L-methionine-dependent methyltransferase n=1 Tax=Thyridium curvatum TaxID=1093900 RepID=A0A507B2G9_9PEZI|nr:uncharacterized protein E0L32_001089 [Thyridium curvatum]TPX11271.1 hypothetical protein E0L32_001089 [Thyridium curvatum]
MSVLGSHASKSKVVSEGNERFNADAASWDANPFVAAMSLEAWAAIQRFCPALFPADAHDADKRPDVLEIGCGTGLLSLEMAPRCRRVVAVDAAEGMIQVLAAKLGKPGAPQNVVPLAILLEDPEDERLPPAGGGGARLKYDLITSHMALHHIPDLRSLLTTMLGCLKPGGMVALTDFEDFGPEAEKFHPKAKMPGVERHGINRQWMEALLKEVGFTDVKVSVAWDHSKMVEKFTGEFGDDGSPKEGQGEMMKFPYVICMGKKA